MSLGQRQKSVLDGWASHQLRSQNREIRERPTLAGASVVIQLNCGILLLAVDPAVSWMVQEDAVGSFFRWLSWSQFGALTVVLVALNLLIGESAVCATATVQGRVRFWVRAVRLLLGGLPLVGLLVLAFWRELARNHPHLIAKPSRAWSERPLRASSPARQWAWLRETFHLLWQPLSLRIGTSSWPLLWPVVSGILWVLQLAALFVLAPEPEPSETQALKLMSLGLRLVAIGCFLVSVLQPRRVRGSIWGLALAQLLWLLPMPWVAVPFFLVWFWEQPGGDGALTSAVASHGQSKQYGPTFGLRWIVAKLLPGSREPLRASSRPAQSSSLVSPRLLAIARWKTAFFWADIFALSWLLGRLPGRDPLAPASPFLLSLACAGLGLLQVLLVLALKLRSRTQEAGEVGLSLQEPWGVTLVFVAQTTICGMGAAASAGAVAFPVLPVFRSLLAIVLMGQTVLLVAMLIRSLNQDLEYHKQESFWFWSGCYAGLTSLHTLAALSFLIPGLTARWIDLLCLTLVLVGIVLSRFQARESRYPLPPARAARLLPRRVRLWWCCCRWSLLMPFGALFIPAWLSGVVHFRADLLRIQPPGVNDSD